MIPDYLIIIPAILAVSHEAKAPANMALTAIFARSLRRPGANAPIPPN